MRKIPLLVCAVALLFTQAFLQAPGPLPGADAAATADTSASSAAADSAINESQYRVVKKDVVVPDQVKIGTTVMVFIIVVMSFFKNFNPD